MKKRVTKDGPLLIAFFAIRSKLKIFSVALLLLTGCSPFQQLWYNSGQTQADFDRNSRACETIASELAREATLTGRREDPETFARVYNGCLHGKGWSRTPAGQRKSGGGDDPPPLAVYNSEGRIEGFGRFLPVPTGFALQSDVVQRHEDTVFHNLLFQRGELFINYTIQKSLGRKFVSVDYPIQDPFFLYEQGEYPGNQARLRWAIFTGEIQGSTVVGLGGYFLLGNRERITIVITMPLPAPAEPAPVGLRLTPGQVQEIEQFRSDWRPWLTGMLTTSQKAPNPGERER